MDALTLSEIGRLMGDGEHDPRGPSCYFLQGEAREGRLRTVENPLLAEYRDAAGNVVATREREHREFLTVRRKDLAAWLAKYGTAGDRNSPAAAWAAEPAAA